MVDAQSHTLNSHLSSGNRKWEPTPAPAQLVSGWGSALAGSNTHKVSPSTRNSHPGFLFLLPPKGSHPPSSSCCQQASSSLEASLGSRLLPKGTACFLVCLKIHIPRSDMCMWALSEVGAQRMPCFKISIWHPHMSTQPYLPSSLLPFLPAILPSLSPFLPLTMW